MEDQHVTSIVAALVELQQDSSVPKNIKERLGKTITALQETCEISLRVDKALQELDELSEESNLQTYTRMQIWSIVSRLEKNA